METVDERGEGLAYADEANGNRVDAGTCIGLVGAPPQLEATSDRFHFWVPYGCLVEKTQIVVTESEIGGKRLIYYAIIDEVTRCSRARSMGHEVDAFDGDADADQPYPSDGITYATASILRVEPPVLAPPMERSRVRLANPEEAQRAYGADARARHSLAVGLIKNGDDVAAGPGTIDTDYLLGKHGGHLNVNGSAGRGAKSSFLLFVNGMLLRQARAYTAANPSGEPFRIVPIIFNVKGFDLFHIDRWNRDYDPARHLAAWQAIGVDDPRPFTGAAFFAPQQARVNVPIDTGRLTGVTPYSWSLKDLIEKQLLEYLFAEEDAGDVNFGALLLDVQTQLTRETVQGDGSVAFTLNTEIASTLEGLIHWIDGQAGEKDMTRRIRGHHEATWKKFLRRLRGIIYGAPGVLRLTEQNGNPLDLVRTETCDPLVVDLSGLAGEPALQRFVVAAILRQLVDARTAGNRVRGLRYLITLDELNRFAPRNGRDPVTRLIEQVAAEMRSQGILLFGAQQQASRVSEVVIENAGIRALGRTSAQELSHSIWGGLSKAARRKAESLRVEEKLVLQDDFREPMHVLVPHPAWAMNPDEVRDDAPGGDQGKSRRLTQGL